MDFLKLTMHAKSIYSVLFAHLFFTLFLLQLNARTSVRVTKSKINCMKKILFFALIVLSINGLQAQIYPKGSFNMSAGYGVGSYGNFFLNLFTKGLDLRNVKTNLAGPVYLKGEYAVLDNFTVGLNVNFSNTTATFTLDSLAYIGKYSGTFGLRSTSAIVRANYTFPFAEDRGGFMLGLGVGYRDLRLSYSDDDPRTPVDGGFSIPFPLTGELTMGLRYYFTENVGGYIETGITRSVLQGGITVRF